MMSTLRIVLLLFLALPMYGQNILINEFMASNSNVIADEFGEFDDWVELFNPTDMPIDIGGMHLTDDLAVPNKWQIPTNASSITTIPADGYLLLWFDKDIQQGALHIDAKLSATGEEIGLFANDGTTLIDSRIFGIQQTDISEGRTPNGGINWGFFSFPTPNAPNTTDPGIIKADTPIASQISGLYNNTLTISLSTTTPNATIHYTLDGSVPTELSEEYTSPITVSENTPLRAVAFADDYAASYPATYNYLIDIDHTFPVVTITADDSLIFDPIIGMYPNYEEDIEIPAHVELIETDGTIGFSQLAEIEIQGVGSAIFPQKSIAMKAKSSMGNSSFDYQVFPELKFQEYRSLVARNSGQDRNVTMFRDAFVGSLVRDLSDVEGLIVPPKVYLQGYRPSVVYLNGEYWGIYNIRERMDKRYFKTHFDLNEDELDVVESYEEASLGDNLDWNNLMEFFNNTDLRIDANFDSLKNKMDTEHYLDYIVFNVFIDNWDWPDNNNKRWRERSPDGRWRFLTYDLDFTFGLFTPQGFNSGVWYNNSLSRLFNEWSTSWPNSIWSTLAFRSMIKNDRWRNDFFNRMADQINILYTEERMNERIDSFQVLYEPEIEAQAIRWADGFIPWEDNISKLRLFADNRVDVMRQHVIGSFNDIWGSANVTLTANPINGGKINFSTVTVGEDEFPWTGVYFTGTDIPITAEAAPGFEFSGWSVDAGNIPINDTTEINWNTTITANFTPVNVMLEQTIAFQDIEDKLVSNPPFQIEATATSELPVGLSIVSGPASISGNTITLDGTIGTVVVQAEQTGNSSFYPTTATTSFQVDLQQTQTIDLSPIENKWIDALPFSIEATASSGLPVELSILSGPASIIGNTITLDGTEGTVTVQAEQTGDLLYSAAPSVTQSFEVIIPLEQEITFLPISDKWSIDIPFEIEATASSGLPIEFSILSGPATIVENVITLNGSDGTVTVEAKQIGDSFYLPAPVVTQSFEVTTPLTQIIDFAALPNRWTNDDPFEIEATSSSGLPVDLSVILGPAQISGNTINLTGMPGTVYVIAEQLGNNEYLPAAVVSRTFEVLVPESQAITFLEIPDKFTTDDPFEIEATASSGLPVSFSILSGPATILGNTITLTGLEGTVTLQADQAGGPGFLSAAPVVQTFDVVLETSLNAPLENENILLEVYPNPFGKVLWAEYTLTETNQLEASLVNVDGKILYHKIWETPSLKDQITIDTSDLPTGVYALILKQGIYQNTIRVMKVGF